MSHEVLSLKINRDGEIEKLTIPVSDGKPRGIAPIIDQQISLSGREIEIHCSASSEPAFKIGPYHLEEAREFTLVERERFIEGVMSELRKNIATSVVIKNSSE